MDSVDFMHRGSVLDNSTVLSVRGLEKKFATTVIAKDMSFDLWPGVHALTGVNGTGKSTLLAMCAGAEPYDGGNIVIAGDDILGAPVLARKNLGWLPDEPCIYPFLTGRAFLSLVTAAKGISNYEAMTTYLQCLQLNPLLNLRFDAMSLGMQRKFMLTAALLGNPKLLILDEPTNGLDAMSLSYLVELIKTRSTVSCILFSTHDQNFIVRTEATVWELANGVVKENAQQKTQEA